MASLVLGAAHPRQYLLVGKLWAPNRTFAGGQTPQRSIICTRAQTRFCQYAPPLTVARLTWTSTLHLLVSAKRNARGEMAQNGAPLFPNAPWTGWRQHHNNIARPGRNLQMNPTTWPAADSDTGRRAVFALATKRLFSRP
eukprot:2814547-Lingulodinium_polyedra.AAC.1